MTLYRNANRGNRLDGNYPNGDAPVIDESLFDISDLYYEGAFRLPGATYGTSELQYQTRAIIGLNKTTGGLLINGLGDANSKALGEFSIPVELDDTLGNLNTATNTQAFIDVLDQATIDIDGGESATISGIYEKDDEIIINHFTYFDTSTITTNTTICKRNATNIGASTTDTDGSFNLSGACNAGGWISEIPAEYQASDKLNGTHISGHSSGNTRTINSRHSLGPSAWVFNAADILSPSNPAVDANITAGAALDFPYSGGSPNEKYLGGAPSFGDFANAWTAAGAMFNHIAEAAFGFIIPGTRTYMVVGYTGGLTNGLTYYLSATPGTPAEENGANGYYPTSPGAIPWREDYTNYYWLFDVDDLIAVRQGTSDSYDPVPYDHGVLNVPFEKTVHNIEGSNITGGAYDAATGKLYLAMAKGDDGTALPSDPPLILVYTLTGGV